MPDDPERPFRLRDLRGPTRNRDFDGVGWARPYRGIRSPVAAANDAEMRIRCAALLLPPTGAVTGWAAAYLRGAPFVDGRDGFGQPLPVPVVVPPSAKIRVRPDLLVSRSALRLDDRQRIDGVPVVSAARNAFDLARSGKLVDALGSVDMLLRTKTVSRAEAIAYALAHPRWEGRPQALTVLEFADRRSESPKESWLRWEWVQAGLPPPLVNPTIYDWNGDIVGRVDLFDEEAAMAGEYEGDVHRERSVFHRDIFRGRGFGDENVIVVRVTGGDLAYPLGLHRSLQAQRERGLRRDRFLDRWQLDNLPAYLDWMRNEPPHSA